MMSGRGKKLGRGGKREDGRRNEGSKIMRGK
jgi:hypothetical protein